MYFLLQVNIALFSIHRILLLHFSFLVTLSLPDVCHPLSKFGGVCSVTRLDSLYPRNISMSRTVIKNVLSVEQSEGVGAKVRRSIGRPEVCLFARALCVVYMGKIRFKKSQLFCCPKIRTSLYNAEYPCATNPCIVL